MANRQVAGKYFMGKMISPYGLEKGFVDYSTLAKSFQKVRKDDILALQAGGWRLTHGFDNDNYWEAEAQEFYIIDREGVEILSYWTDEFIWYNVSLDLWVWGVTHAGTRWDYVLTDIKCQKVEGAE